MRNEIHKASQIALSVIIPAFNEEKRLPTYIQEIMDYLKMFEGQYEVIIVDDGSTDNTSRIVESFKVRYPTLNLIKIDKNCGKGYAVRKGMLNASGRLRLFADADGTIPINELEVLIAAIDNGADIAVGSKALRRTGGDSRWKRHRKIAGAIFNFIVRALAVNGIRDTQCGFKLFKDKIAIDVFPKQRLDGFGFDVETLFIAQKRGYHIVEIPVKLAERIGGSKVRLLSDGFRMLIDILRIRAYDFQEYYNK